MCISYEAVTYLYLFRIVLLIKKTTISISHKMCQELSIFINHLQTSWSESLCHYIIVVSRRNNQNIFSDVESKLGTYILSVDGDGNNMAGTPCITHPMNLTEILLFEPSQIIFLHLFDSHSINITRNLFSSCSQVQFFLIR